MSHKSKKQGLGKLAPLAGMGTHPPRGGGVEKKSGWPGIQVAGIRAALIAIVFAVFGQVICFGFIDYDNSQRALQLAQSGSRLAGELQREMKGCQAGQPFQ